jgi:hypothetical protein
MRWFCLSLIFVVLSLAAFVSTSWPTDAQNKRSSTQRAQSVNTCTPPPAGMVSWWRAENNAFDQQGSNNGTLQGGATFAGGEVGQAFSFSSNGDEVLVPHNANQNTGAQITVDAWIRPTSFNGNASIINKRTVGNAEGYSLETNPSGGLYFEITTPGGVFRGGTSGSTSVLSANVWQHVSATYDGSTVTVYVNGSPVGSSGSANGAINAVTADLVIGKNIVTGASFPGLIDEVELFDRALSQSEIQAIFNAGSNGKCITCAPPPANMVSWWPADGNTTDIRGPNNGTLQGGATFAAGEVGQAFSFNGSSFVTVPDNPSLQLPDAPFSIDLWFNTSTTATSQMILSKGVSDANEEYSINLLTGGGIYWDYGGLQGDVVSNVGAIQAGQWYHLTVLYDPAFGFPRGKIYLNGVEQTITSFGVGAHIASSGSALYIGSQNAGSPYYAARVSFNGLIDEVEIFNRTLSQTEIQKIYNAGSQGKCKTCATPPSNMVAWWPGEGNPFDVQGANDGTLQNGATFAAGEVGRAFSLDGINDFVQVTNSASLNITGNQVTLDGWINPSSTMTNEAWFFGRSGDGGQPYALEWESGVIVGRVASTPIVGPPFTPPANTWTHLTLVYNGSATPSTTIYVNGAVYKTSNTPTGNIPSSSTDFFIGELGGNGRYFGGLVDEVEVFNRALSESEVRAIYNAGSNGKCRTCTPPPANMIDWWPAEGNANDIVGAHNGTLQNGATFATGYVGQAFKLDGVADSVDVGAVGLTGTFTIDAWVNPAQLSGDTRTIISKDDGANHSYQFYFFEGQLQLVVFSSAGLTAYSTSAVGSLNAWQHVAVTYNGSAAAGAKMNFYVNGVNASSSVQGGLDNGGTPNNISTPARIGAFASGAHPYQGLIDELEIFNRVLTAAEIRAIVNGCSAGKCLTETINKSFGAPSITENGTTSLSFTITNPNPTSSQTGIGFSDTLPAGLLVATPNGLTGSCGGGTITATAGSNAVSLSGATLGASGSCTFSVNVRGTAAGVKNNTTGNVTSNEGGIGGTASASITVVVAPPTISKAFGKAKIALNSSTSLGFTITNPNATTTLNGIGFSDTLPAGLIVSTPNGLTGSCGGGTITATQGTNSISLTGASLAAGASCTFSVNVTGTSVGVQNNTTGNVSSTEGGAGGTASASVTVCSLTTITCPGGITKFADSGQLGATINPGAPVTSGGCAPVTVTGLRSDGKPLNALYPIGVTLITWTATDASNASMSCGQSIAVMVPSGERRRPEDEALLVGINFLIDCFSAFW